MKTAIFVSALILASTANAGKSYMFTYNFYWQGVNGQDRYITQLSSTVRPSTLNKYMTNPNIYAVPQNASSQYAPWHKSLSIKAPSCNRGSAKQKAAVCR